MQTFIKFFLENFSVPLIFYFTFKAYGARPAIAVAVIAIIVEAIILYYRRGKISPIFLVISFFTVFFGGTDLILKVPNYYQYEPFAQSALVGTVLWCAVIFKIPIARWFAEGLPEKFRPKINELPSSYFSIVTLVWSLYFYIKAFTYLYLSKKLDLGTLILVRPFIGNGSFILLLLIEWQVRRRLIKKRRKKLQVS